MSWCQSHPRYSAKREPNSLCGSCWILYFYRCPEEKSAAPPAKMLQKVNRKSSVGEIDEPDGQRA